MIRKKCICVTGRCLLAKRLLLSANQKALRLLCASAQKVVSEEGYLHDWLVVKKYSKVNHFVSSHHCCANKSDGQDFQQSQYSTMSAKISLIWRHSSLGIQGCNKTKCLFLPPLGKGKRLKQAKEEATAEIDHYRLQREKEFRNKETNVRKLRMFFCHANLLSGKPDCFQEYYMETPANQRAHTD